MGVACIGYALVFTILTIPTESSICFESSKSYIANACSRRRLLIVNEEPEVERESDTRPVKRVNGVHIILTTSTLSYLVVFYFGKAAVAYNQI